MVCFSAPAATANRSAASSGPAGENPINQPRGEAVAAADPIDDPNDVALTAMERLTGRVPQHGAPAVVAGRQAFTQRDRDDGRAELARHAFRRRTVAG